MNGAGDRIRAEVERWFLTDPLLLAAWSTHRLRVDAHATTIQIAHGNIGYSPAWIDRLRPSELRSVLRAEALRILLQHPYGRRRPSARHAWAASNLALSELLTDPLLPLPRAMEVFGRPDWDGRSYEFYYNRLVEEAPGAAGGGEGGGEGEEGDPGEESPGASGGGAGALQQWAEGDPESACGWEEEELLCERLADCVRQAQETNTWGSLAGRMRERILATLQPKVDYRAVLRQFRASVLCSARVRTRMKPNRRYGFLTMGSRKDFTTRLVVAIDVSGSMSAGDVAAGLSIVNHFFKYGVEAVDVIQFDTIIQGPVLSLKKARREVVVLGRGGTSFDSVMRWIEENDGYDGLIVYTDGAAPVPLPPRRRGTRVLWLFTTEGQWRVMQAGLSAIGVCAYVKGD